MFLPERGSSVFTIFLVLFCYAEFIEAANRLSHCSDLLPNTLSQLLRESYPDWRILDKRTHKLGCPGIAKVDLYGDGRVVYAIAVEKTTEVNSTIDEKLIMASKKDSRWELSILEQGEAPVTYGGNQQANTSMSTEDNH
jgi:hypothetical protein